MIRELFVANQTDILNYLARRVEHPEDAADLFSETFLVAWRRRRSVPSDPVEARKWLFVTARTTLLNHRRASRRAAALGAKLRLEVVASDPSLATEVRVAVDSLGPEHAELVKLVHWDGFTIADAAEILGMSASTARSRYAVARSRLQVALGLEVTSR